MKKTISLALILISILSTPCFATSLGEYEKSNKPEQPSITVSNVLANHIYIPENTVIECELITPASSKKNKVNDILVFKTTENLVINNVIVVPRGTTGQAIVTKASRAGMFGHGGSIEFAPRVIKTINNIEVPLTFQVGNKGDDANMALGIIGLGVFSVLLGGKNITIPSGTKFNVAVQCNVDLNCTKDTLSEKMVPAMGDMLVTTTSN